MYRQRFNRKVDKYKQPRGKRAIWWSPKTTPEELRAADTLYVIEGEKKAARFYKKWPKAAVIGIGGAWNFMEPTDIGTNRLIADFVAILQPGKSIIAIFDGDILAKPGIQMAANALREQLRPHSCTLQIMYPPQGNGVDDWLEAEPDATFSDLQKIEFDALEESRKQLYQVLGCNLNDGKLILNELNAKKILEHYFEQNVYLDKRLGLVSMGDKVSHDSFELTCIEYLQGQINAHFKTGTVRGGAALMLHNRKRDLVQEMLREYVWDGVPRLNTWGSKYFEAEWPEYANEWGRILMTGLALRILEPGTKVDKVCILAGAQGIGKSTFFEALSEFGGEQFYFACTSIASSAGDANRTQGMMLARSTVVDLAEGVVFETRKATMDMVKQVLTQTHDEFRLPYSKSPSVEPRGFIFVGTTNRFDQLSDQTGSRRYLYLEALKITRLPYEEKMQILAEVVASEAALRGTAWWEERVDVATMPESLRPDDTQHVKTVQEIVNARFTKDDASETFVLNLIESGELLRLSVSNKLFITAVYLNARCGKEVSDMASSNMWGRKLSALANSPTFPYKLTHARKRIPQLTGGNEQVKLAYLSGISNNQQMIVGYEVEKK
jgi:hypothetical protein